MTNFSISRREAMKWTGVAALLAGAGTAVSSCQRAYVTGEESVGYGKDPPLIEPVRQPWPRLLNDEQRSKMLALIDAILPATAELPAASEIGVMEFFEEWLSAPYDDFVADRKLILPFLDRAGTPAVIAGSIESYRKDDAFERLRVLTASAYYTAPESEEAIGFGGNYPRDSFNGPPQEVLDHFDREYAKLA